MGTKETKETELDYFSRNDYISNSQLRSFVSFNKFGEKIYTPEIYRAFYIDKTKKFIINDAIRTGKIVDRYFDGEGEKVWDSYEVKARRNSEDKLDEHIIGNAQKEDAEAMISWGEDFKQFKDFISLPDTENQKEIFKEVEITDNNGEVFKIKIKGVFDFFNNKKKKIVDLKTTGSLDMVITDLVFRGEPRLSSYYLRQLAMYNFLSGGGFDGALAVITTSGVKWIEIKREILEYIWEDMKEDIMELHKFINNPGEYKEKDLFYNFGLDEGEGVEFGL